MMMVHSIDRQWHRKGKFNAKNVRQNKSSVKSFRAELVKNTRVPNRIQKEKQTLLKMLTNITNLSVMLSKMYLISLISKVNVEALVSMSSSQPIRENMLSTSFREAYDAGIKQPTWAMI